jgi:ABC-type glycerol-3-phosphate transport system permease component
MGVQARRLLGNAVVYIILIVFALLFVFPYWWMLISSVRDPDLIFRYSSELSWLTIWPESFRLDGYIRVLFEEELLRYMGISLLVGCLVTVGSLFINSLAGFAFARLRFPGQRVMFWIALATFMLPAEATVIPLFVEVKTLGWLNTLQGLIVPFVASGFGVFLFSQFISDLPRELDDAALIDGCGWFGVYWRIIMPQLGTAMVSMGILVFAGTWNSFFWPLVATRGEKFRVAQLKLALLASDMFAQGMLGWGALLAAATILVLPLVIAFLFLQRYYVRGISMTGFR